MDSLSRSVWKVQFSLISSVIPQQFDFKFPQATIGTTSFRKPVKDKATQGWNAWQVFPAQ